MEEKVEYLSIKDIDDIYHYMEEILEYCLENKKEEAYNTIKEVYANYRVVLQFDPKNCNVFLKGKF